MDQNSNSIIEFIVNAILLLFGHANLWPTLVSILSGLIFTAIFMLFFGLFLFVASTNRFGIWPTNIAKSFLVLQSIVIAYFLAGIIAIFSHELWDTSVTIVLLPFLILIFIPMLFMIKRFGRKKKISGVGDGGKK